MKKAALLLIVPSLTVGSLVGFLVGHSQGGVSSTQIFKAKTQASAHAVAKESLRQSFLSNEKSSVDYEKLARVCLTAASRSRPKTRTQASALADPDSPEVNRTKGELDKLISVSMESGIWSRAAGFAARRLMQKLPATDVADFENLLRTIMERGDLQTQPGAWHPREMN